MGGKCKFRHLYNDVQGYGHENNKRRHDSHYDHYGNLLTSSQNNYSYGDGPIDSWSYARSDGRHHNKQASNGPDIYKNHNINNKHVNHSGEKCNQGVNFLGHQLNPTDWPTIMEAKLLKTQNFTK